MRTVAMTALGGTSIEWYDFFIYGTAAALVFPTLFFSDDMPRYVSLLASFSTFAVGFLARPVGGVVFGHFGDRVGRKAALVTCPNDDGRGDHADRIVAQLRADWSAGARSADLSALCSGFGLLAVNGAARCC
jgi:MFS family permease